MRTQSLQENVDAGNTEPIRLLYVDDEPALVDLAERKMRSLGYVVTGVTSSRQALNLFQDNPRDFDVVVADVMMPETHGDQMARLMHRTRPDLPVILISGYDYQIESGEAQRLNIVAYLYKPFRMEELDQRIRAMIPGG